MDAQFDTCLSFTLGQEGGFADNPDDPGGATFKGITLASLREYLRDPDATVEDLRALDQATIAKFYRSKFWNEMQCGVLPPGVDLMIFDHGVNVGQARPVPMLQDIVGVRADGKVGPHTLAAIGTWSVSSLIGALRASQETYYRGLEKFPIFGNGWLNRLSRRYTASMRLTQRVPATNA